MSWVAFCVGVVIAGLGYVLGRYDRTRENWRLGKLLTAWMKTSETWKSCAVGWRELYEGQRRREENEP